MCVSVCDSISVYVCVGGYVCVCECVCVLPTRTVSVISLSTVTNYLTKANPGRRDSNCLTV